MTEKNKSDTINQYVGNMPAESPSSHDNQYVPLSFVPTTEPINWSHPNDVYYPTTDSFPGYNLPFDNYLPHPPPPASSHIFETTFHKNNDNTYNLYHTDPLVYDTNYRLLLASNHHHLMQNERPEPAPTPINEPNTHHLIENLVGNWVSPTSTGTYSPFGPTNSFEPAVVFDNTIELPTDAGKNVEKPFGNKKQRIVAEVKPMRPSYSDVLTKPVPQTFVKSTKNEQKDVKSKKENKKNNKNDKLQQKYTISGRNNINNNTLNESKENTDRIQQSNRNNNEKTVRVEKNVPLNRKWVSLDDIIDSIIAEESGNDTKTKTKNEIKNNLKNNRKTSKNFNENTSHSEGHNRNDSSSNFNPNKNVGKKSAKIKTQQKGESTGNGERTNKKYQRIKKKDNNLFYGFLVQKSRQYLNEWWKMLTIFFFWLITLISDVFSLSIHISSDFADNLWIWSCDTWNTTVETGTIIMHRNRFLTWLYKRFKHQPDDGTSYPSKDSAPSSFPSTAYGLPNNIPMPLTGEEAMKRLLACKGKDPYSILGVMPQCTDEDIKRYYKRQAFLVHPDKNQQPGAEEAFKILVHAFDMIGEPARRADYDKGVVESVQAEQVRTELSELIARFKQKMETVANTIRCSACGLKHKRMRVERPCYAARNCATCRIHHSAREGDIWAEARCFGFLWHYYACMEGGVYDISEWAGCQRESLKHLRPDSHQVQYRIALGGRQTGNGTTGRGRNNAGLRRGTEQMPDLEHLLNTLYGQQEMPGTRRKTKKTK